MTRRAPNPTRVGAVIRRQYYVTLRAPQRWFDVLVWPMVDTVIWGSIGKFVQEQGGATRSSVPYMLSGILLMHVIYQSNVSFATGFMDETWDNNLLNVLVTPLREYEYVLGMLVVSSVRMLLGLSMVAFAAALLYAFNVTSAGIGLIPVVAILMVSGWCVALIVIGLILRFGNGAEILTWGILFIVVALSGVFYPISALPAALQPIALALPSSHAFSVARALLDGKPMPWGQLGIAALGTLVIVPLATAFALRMLRTFRARGFITRYT
jgi:ABC-2 type transport system permease protein